MVKYNERPDWGKTTLPFFPAWAKLNLGLEVGARRPDGYHEIRSIMQTVSLADQVKLEWTTGSISLEVEGADLPADSGNIAMRAAKLMRGSSRWWFGRQHKAD
jgi:4-diphosphocytidyl-2-C-methyl-D-erythritol kinase